MRSGAKLAATLAQSREDALLFRRLAILVRDGPEVGTPDDWRWRGPGEKLEELADYLDAPQLAVRTERLAVKRGSPSYFSPRNS